MGGLGSSSGYPATQASVSGGIMSQDCSVNPQFCTWNFVYLKYCDGDSFSGAREGTVTFNGKPLSFRGHYVLEAVFDSLAANLMKAATPWASATDIVLSGCSAGGLSTFLHTQFVHDTYLPAGARFHSVPVSGFFLDAMSVQGIAVYTQQMQVVWDLQQPMIGVNAACVADWPADQAWRCNMAEYVYRYITAPIFPLNSAYDSWQLPCELTAIPVPGTNTTQNGDCDAAPGWQSCGKNYETCTNTQMIPVNNYYLQFIAKMNNTATAMLAQNGAFISSCETHCEALGGGWASFVVDGVSMRDAVAAWMADPAPTPQKHLCVAPRAQPRCLSPCAPQSLSPLPPPPFPPTPSPPFGSHYDVMLNGAATPRKTNPTC